MIAIYLQSKLISCRAISRDPSIYPDPDAFRPERFEEMDAETLEMYDPRKYVFGFGRR